jgi:hypothetical protein
MVNVFSFAEETVSWRKWAAMSVAPSTLRMRGGKARRPVYDQLYNRGLFASGRSSGEPIQMDSRGPESSNEGLLK